MTRVRYRPAGSKAWRVAVDDSAVVLLSPDVTDHTAAAVWQRVGEGGIGALLEALTGAFGTSLTAIPPFVLAVVEDGGVRVAVRGPLEILVEDAAGTQAVTGQGIATWTERFLPGVRRLSVRLGDSGAEGSASEQATLPIRSGVVGADVVVVELVSPGTAPSGQSPASAAVEEPEAAAEVLDATHVGPVVADVTGTPGAADADGVSESSLPQDTVGETWMPVSTDAPWSDGPATADDDLWGATVVRPTADAPADAEPGSGAGDPAAPAAPAAPAGGQGSPASGLGDHDGQTVAVAEMRAMRAAERASYESTDSVPARSPSRGRIVLSTGRTVQLERPVVIGRRPKSTRTTGSDLPTLVAVDSPEQDISRSHIEIRAEGEHVLVTDLDTTNGTVLLRGGQDPVRLHPGEPTMVISGDVLDIGDGVTVTFEDLP